MWDKAEKAGVVVGVAIAFALLLVTAWQATDAQQASADQLALARQQFAQASRPIVVPVPNPNVPVIDPASSRIRFDLKNTTNAPALTGDLSIAGFETKLDPSHVMHYPTCGDDGYAHHSSTFFHTLLPPIAGGETITADLGVIPTYAPGRPCVRHRAIHGRERRSLGDGLGLGAALPRRRRKTMASDHAPNV